VLHPATYVLAQWCVDARGKCVLRPDGQWSRLGTCSWACRIEASGKALIGVGLGWSRGGREIFPLEDLLMDSGAGKSVTLLTRLHVLLRNWL
jgi:hypothetical protein